MEVPYQTCCGLDVHQATVVACVRHPTKGGRRKSDVRTFGTTTVELLQLADWLTEHGIVANFRWGRTKLSLPVTYAAKA
jgi:hypothetical protein